MGCRGVYLDTLLVFTTHTGIRVRSRSRSPLSVPVSRACLPPSDPTLRKPVDNDVDPSFSPFVSSQEIFNLLPNVGDDEFVASISGKSNDEMLCVYLGSLVRGTIALHNLIDNQVCAYLHGGGSSLLLVRLSVVHALA